MAFVENIYFLNNIKQTLRYNSAMLRPVLLDSSSNQDNLQNQDLLERILLHIRTHEWNQETESTKVLREFCQHNQISFTKGKIIILAKIISRTSDIYLDRMAQHHMLCTLKWFDENWEMIKPNLQIYLRECISRTDN